MPNGRINQLQGNCSGVVSKETRDEKVRGIITKLLKHRSKQITLYWQVTVQLTFINSCNYEICFV